MATSCQPGAGYPAGPRTMQTAGCSYICHLTKLSRRFSGIPLKATQMFSMAVQPLTECLDGGHDLCSTNCSKNVFQWQTPCFSVCWGTARGVTICESTNMALERHRKRSVKRKVMRKQAARRKAGRPPGGVDGQRVRDYPQVSIRVPPKLYTQLASLSRSTGLSRLEIFVRAIDCFEDQLRAQRRRNRRRAA